MDRKWWTWLVRNVDSPNFSPRLRDKIWEWPGDEATKLHHLKVDERLVDYLGPNCK